VAGSLLAHAALLAASAGSSHALAGSAPPREHHGSGAFFVHADLYQPGCFSWAPSNAVASCFDQTTLHDQGFATSHLRAYGYEVDPHRSWERFPQPEGGAPEDQAITDEMLHSELRECTAVAARAGWSGEGRVFVRVTRETADTALVQALPLDGEANDPGLLCCLRNAQDALLRSMTPGQTERYVLSGGPDFTLTPPP
jgi:hypothetical protein